MGESGPEVVKVPNCAKFNFPVFMNNEILSALPVKSTEIRKFLPLTLILLSIRYCGHNF